MGLTSTHKITNTQKARFLVLPILLVILTIVVNAQVNRSNNKKSVPYKASYQRMAEGGYHSLEIKDGKIWAWGDNVNGQLGDGTYSNRVIPKQIGTDNKWVGVTAGWLCSFGIKSDGSLWSWGDNSSGQLGDGTTTNKNNPLQIGNGNSWIGIAAGQKHTVGLKADGTLWAWGDNSFGQLGDGTLLNKSIPIQIGIDDRWVEVIAAGYHTIGLKSDGTLWAWGRNNYGQLGDGTQVDKNSPIQIGTDNRWSSVKAGIWHSMGLKSDGTLWAWGLNDYGQLGDGTMIGKNSPEQIGNENNWRTIAPSGHFTHCIKSDGTLWAWGANSDGELGDGTTIAKSSPVQIGTDNDWVTVIGGGDFHCLALRSNGTLWSWGYNYFGQLGDGTTVNNSTPQSISTTQNNWLNTAAGFNHTVSLKSDGTLWAWGMNNSGQLGDATSINKTCPVQITNEHKWTSITTGGDHTLSLKSDGTLWAWGANYNGQLGDGTIVDKNSPVQIGSDNKWISISAGFYHSLGLKSDGTLWAWGLNNSGQLGDGTFVNKLNPVQIGSDNKWVSVCGGGDWYTTGSYYSVGLKSDGTLWAWGNNVFGQLGDGTVIAKINPIQIGSDNKWVSISAGMRHTLGLKSDGTLWAWGGNNYGQLGDGTISNKISPVQIGTDNKWIAIKAGSFHSVGLKSNGTIWSWGDNQLGQLGDGTQVDRHMPVQAGTDNNWVTITAAIGFHTLAIKSDRNQFCATGSNNVGQLGDCSTINKSSFGCTSSTVSSTLHYPFNPYLDVSNNGTNQWNFGGSYQASQLTNDFSGEINNFLGSNASNSSPVLVPLKLHSDSAGVLKITDLAIQYSFTDTIPPNFVTASLSPALLAKNSMFTIGIKASDNEKVDSVKASFNNNTYNLAPVSTDSFTVSIVADTIGNFPVTVTVSDISGLKRDTVLYVTVYSPVPDVEVLNNNISIVPATIFVNDSVHLTAIVKNNSNLNIPNLQVALIINGNTQLTKTVTLNPLAQAQVNFDWLAKMGQDTIRIKADPLNLITESNKNNNTGTKIIIVNNIDGPQMLEAFATPNPAYIGTPVFVKVKVIDSISIASLNVNWQNQNVVLAYNPVSGYYEGYLNANTVGNADAIITAFDINNLLTTTALNIPVLQNLPDLKIFSSDISFSSPTASSGNTSVITVKVYNSGNIDVTGASLKFIIDGNTVETQNIVIMHDSSTTASFNYTVSCGSHNFMAIIDSANTITETDDSNNSAVVSHQFCLGQVQHTISATAIPAIVSLGSAVSIHAIPSPLNGIAAVTALWNNQPLAMIYDNNVSAYTLVVTPAQTGSYTIPIVLLDSDNIQRSTLVQFTVTDSLPDISVNNISPSNYPVIGGNNTLFNIKVSNNNIQSLSAVTVHLLVDGTVKDSIIIPSFPPLDTISIPLHWIAANGLHVVSATADMHNTINEGDESNNTKNIDILPVSNEPPIINFIHLSSPLYQGGTLSVETSITYWDTLQSVVCRFMGNNYPMTFDPSNLLWKATLNTPAAGTYNLGITATGKNSLAAYSTVRAKVNLLLPDLEILPQHIIYERVNTVLSKATLIVSNNGGTAANNAKILLLLDGVAIDSSAVTINAGETDTVVFSFNPSIGLHLLIASIDPYNGITEGNESNNFASRDIFVADLTPPSSPVVTVNPPDWSANQNFVVSWTPSTDNVGIVSYEISLNGNNWTDAGNVTSVNLIAPLEGTNQVLVRAKDSSGNLSIPGAGEMKFDNTPPNAPLIAEYHCGTYWTLHESPYLEWINPGDVGSGVEYFEVSVDNQAPINIGLSLHFHDTLISGIHALRVRAVDYAGHQGAWSNIITVRIDLDDPLSPTVASSTHPDPNHWYRNDSVSLSWNRPPETSSVTGYFWMLTRDSAYHADQASYWTTNDSLTLTAIHSMDTSRIRIPDGIWYVRFSSQDTVGHISPVSSGYKFKIDKTPPVTTSNKLDTVSYCSYSFNLHAEDYFSGVAATYYRVNGGNWINDTTVTLTLSGINRIEFYSKDSAGNNERIDTVYVLQQKPLASVSYTGICVNTPTLFTGTSPVTASPVNHWYWDFGDGNGASIQSPSHQYNNSGQFTIRFALTNQGNCSSDTVTKVIAIRSVPKADFSFDSTCFGKPVHFKDRSTGANTVTSWAWDLGNGQLSGIPDPVSSYFQYRTFNVSLVAGNSFGCTSTKVYKSFDIRLVNIFAGNDTTIARMEPLQLLATGANSYLWTPTTGLNNNAIFNPIATLSGNYQIYRVKGTTAEGCTGYDDIIIKIIDQTVINVPDAFTPDGNGLNDMLSATPGRGVKLVTFFTIHNRVGQMIFYSADGHGKWDGTFKGVQQPMGTYVWEAGGVAYDGTVVRKTGTVILIR